MADPKLLMRLERAHNALFGGIPWASPFVRRCAVIVKVCHALCDRHGACAPRCIMVGLKNVPVEEWQHYYHCLGCGGFYDRRDLDQVLYHVDGICKTGEPMRRSERVRKLVEAQQRDRQRRLARRKATGLPRKAT